MIKEFLLDSLVDLRDQNKKEPYECTIRALTVFLSKLPEKYMPDDIIAINE